LIPENYVILNSPVEALKENGFVVDYNSFVPVWSKRVKDVILQYVGLFIVTVGRNTEYGSA
jgi:hypothetical protein